MNAKLDAAVKELTQVLLESGKNKTSPYDTQAEVKRVEGNIAWVHIPGGVDETPVRLTMNAQAGDIVQVRVSGGNAWLAGNATSPPTDDTRANVADAKADDAINYADAARINASNAYKIASNTEQHFWMTETGDDTGAHITEKAKEDFLADPTNGGGNLLARSNGIAVRDGLTELASFGADGQTFNNDYGEEVFRIGKLPYSTKDKRNWVEYDNTAPFTMTLPWNVKYGSAATVAYLDANRNAIRNTGISPTRTGRTITWTAAQCNTMASLGVKYIYVDYKAEGRFPYFTVGSDGVGGIGNYSYREGENCVASGNTSHAEGESTEASGANSHAEGESSKATGSNSHAQNLRTVASGRNSHAGGAYTIAQGYAQTVIGAYNVASGQGEVKSDSDNAFIIGGGTSSERKNAMAVTFGGDTTIAGTLTQSSDRRLKDHIAYLDDDADEFIRQLKPAHYIKDDKHHVGFYAQDVDEADKWDCMTGEMNGYMTLGYTELIAPLVAYCQHLEERIEELEIKK